MFVRTISFSLLVLLLVISCQPGSTTNREQEPPVVEAASVPASGLPSPVGLVSTSSKKQIALEALDVRVKALEDTLYKGEPVNPNSVGSRIEALEHIHEMTPFLSVRGALSGYGGGGIINSLTLTLDVISEIDIEALTVAYVDSYQTVSLERIQDATTEPGWDMDSSNIESAGYINMTINISHLDPPLGISTEFTLEIGLRDERSLILTKRTPAELSSGTHFSEGNYRFGIVQLPLPWVMPLPKGSFARSGGCRYGADLFDPNSRRRHSRSLSSQPL